MIPLWSLPVAIACGNTLLIKPSERDPGAATMLAQLAEKAGVPPGVVSVIHGGPETVNYLCDDPRIKAISFVGGDKAGKHIWDRAGANGKRVQVSKRLDRSHTVWQGGDTNRHLPRPISVQRTTRS